MLEWLLFSPMQMPMETVRIFLAVLGMAVASYYDLFNNRNVPEMLLYGFLALAFIFNIVFFDYDVFVYAVVLAFIFLVVGFALYRVGQLGGADVIMIVSLVLLLPISPSYLEVPFNYPFIFSVLVFGCVVTVVCSLFYFANIMARKKLKAKPNYSYLLLLVVYALFVYLFLNAPFFSMAYFAIASILLISTIIYLIFRDAITEATMKQMFVKDLEPEEVIVKEKMDLYMKKMKMGPVLKQKDIDALKKSGTKHVWVYANLPPFLPFLLIGLLVALFFGNQLFLVF